MKVKNVKLGRHLNMALWTQGYRHPISKVEVSAELIKDKEGDYVYAELVGITKETLKKEKVEKKTGLAGKIEELTSKDNKKLDEKTEEKKEEEKILKEKTTKPQTKSPVKAEKVNVKAEASKLHEKTIITQTNKKER